MSIPLRGVDLARLSVGAVLLVRPGLPGRLTRTTTGPRARLASRLLGVRYVLQGGAGGLVRHPLLPRVDAAVDGLHAASMLAVVGLDQSHRRLALASAAFALGCAWADLVTPNPHAVGNATRRSVR
jgi:hypothetical protein